VSARGEGRLPARGRTRPRRVDSDCPNAQLCAHMRTQLWLLWFSGPTNRGTMNTQTHKSRCSGRARVCRRLFAAGGLALVLLVLVPSAALAAGNDVGANVGGLLKHYAGELYGGIVAAFSLVFLLNRRYTELAVFLFAAVVVAWMVFAPDEIGKAAEAIGKQIFE
jgi:hypothetical protein